MEEQTATQLHILPRKEHENNRQYAYRVLYENIMSLRLEPGRQLSDAELAEKLNISRTPIREAFVHLKDSRLVEIYPQRSSCVSHINMDYVEEGIFLRHAVEGNILRVAAREAGANDIMRLKENLAQQRAALAAAAWQAYVALDNAFHRDIYHIARKPWIWDTVSSISTHLNRVRLLQIRAGSETLFSGCDDHAKLFDMLVSQDMREVESFLYEHITAGYRLVLPVLLSQYPSYFVSAG